MQLRQSLLLLATLFAVTAYNVQAASVLVPRETNLPNETDQVENADCERKMYQFESNANRTVFNLDALGFADQINQTQITEVAVNFTTSLVRKEMSQFTDAYQNGTMQASQSFNISGVFCKPKENARQDAPLLTLIHGIAFDSSYWNFGSEKFNVSQRDYSFAYAAAAKGYATFRYDRIGTGESERPQDGYNVVQAPTEVGLLADVVLRARNTSDIGGQQWNKTVLIGHSYGSVQSQAVSAQLPDLVDGVVLTGFSAYQMGLPFNLLSSVFTQASEVFPDRFADIPPAWLTTGTRSSFQQNFVYPYSVTEGAFNLTRSTEQPVTQGSLFTISQVTMPAAEYKGPVQVVLGEKDFIFALGEAVQNGTNLADQANKMLYPASKNATSYIVPLTGHGIAFHTTAGQANQQILSFLADNDL